MGRIVAGGNPGHHIVPVGRHKGLDQQIFCFRLTRQPEQHVVRFHGLLCLIKHLDRNGPQIFPVIEDLDVGHVVGQVLEGLNLKQIFRVADVDKQRLRHFG